MGVLQPELLIEIESINQEGGARHHHHHHHQQQQLILALLIGFKMSRINRNPA